ncbi:MAG: nucleoside-diphosphate kinase [Cytophagales bacterium]|nr:nucleoside-diphosphate kinase [Cytophagales bacterium]
MEYTFSMIKPGAVEGNNIGAILQKIEVAGFSICAMKKSWLTKEQAQVFYEVHKDRPFFDDLTEFMSSGPIIALIIEKENAVEDFRTLIGATDPSKAEPGTIRAMFAKSVSQNAIHGSDSIENAEIEADYFFAKRERY